MKLKNPCLFCPNLLALTLATYVGLLATMVPAKAQSLVYSNSFDVDDRANWTSNSVFTIGDPALSFNGADWHYDYSTVGIPAAPNPVGSGGTTFGLKLWA